MFKHIRKPLSVFLAIVMALSVLPFAIFAEEWKSAAAETAQEAPEEQTRQGKLIAAEITVGNTKSTYALNEEGKLELVSEETLSKRGLRKAPKKSDETPANATGWESFTSAEIKNAAKWAIDNAYGTAKAFVSGGNATVVYGIKDYGVFTDANHDLRCDVCGCCLNGCTDGETKWYTESDIAPGTGADAEGKYYNTENVWIGTDAKGTYTYDKVDEEGNVVYNEDGTRQTVTTEYTYIQFETYVDGANGECDVCGNSICNSAGHEYADGLCDGCGSCMDSHVDAAGAKQEIGDGFCDVCAKAPHTYVDSDSDNKCDICGLDASHVCVDATGAEKDVADGKCDNCGYCMGDCTDADSNGVCDVCGKAMLTSCGHSDLFGKDACTKCALENTSCKHRTLVRLQQLSSQMTAMLTELKKRPTEGEGAADQDFINNTLKPLLTAKEDGGADTSLASVIAMRSEFETAKKTDTAFQAYYERINGLTVDDVTAAGLVGVLKKNDAGETVLDGAGSLFAQNDEQLQQYAPVYEQTKAYITDYDTRAARIAECEQALLTLTAELCDKELADLYGTGGKPKYFIVTDESINKLRNQIKAMDEALLWKLYGSDWCTDAVESKAEQIWNSKQTNPSFADDQERRAVGFALLSGIQFDINAMKEAAFKSFEQKTYDTNGYYSKREASQDDILRNPDLDSDDYLVTEETINQLVSRIDGFAASQEAVALVAKLLPESFGITVKDYNGDGKTTMFDLLMSFLAQVLFSDEVINQIFALIFPTVTKLPAEIPKMLTKSNDYVEDLGGGHYRVDVVKAIFLLAGGSGTTGETVSTILDSLAIGGSFDFYVDGGKAKSLKKLLQDAGFSFWPKDVAKLVSQQSTNGRDYSAIVRALNNCGDDWNRLLDADGKLNFEWNVDSFDDFESILSIILGAVSPVLEMLFAEKVEVHDKLNLSNAVYFSILISLTLINIPAASDGGLTFYPHAFHFYEDIVVPVFEALGINTFAPADGSTVEGYSFNHIKFDKNLPTTDNVKKVVQGLTGPLFALLNQFATHPLEKLLSILPNVMIMLENGKLFDLLNLDTTYSAFIQTSFNLNSVSDFFSGLGDIIEDQIMKHWYDWLNPVKYAQLVATTLAYSLLQPVLGLIFSFMSLIDLEWVADLGIIDVSDQVNDVMKDTVFPLFPDLFNMFAGMLGGKLKDGAFPSKETWPKDVKISTSELLGDLNLSELIDEYFLSADAVRTLGFDFGKISTVLEWFFGNLVDGNGQPIHLLNLALLDLQELSSLGTLKKYKGSLRDSEYKKRWNDLKLHEYYHVDARISDVFYYCVRLVSGLLQDTEAIETILSMLGLDYGEIKEALANLTAEQMDTLDLSLQALLKNACDADGKLDLDKLRANLTTENLLNVMCELLLPRDYTGDTLTYPKAAQTTLDEVAAHKDKIPYLEYDNRWTEGLARFAVEDIDDLADELLRAIPFDLDPSTAQIESLREYARPLILELLNKPEYVTLVAELLCELYDDALEMPADLLKDATGIDVTSWRSDFGYLFDALLSEPTPAAKIFKNLRGERIGSDEDGRPLVDWYYTDREGTEKKVETYSDIFAALGELLVPVQPLLDMVFCGKDFQALAYTKDGVPSGALVTVQGHDGYNFAMLPLLEAMGIENALTPVEFKEMGTAKALLKCVDQIVERLFAIFDSPTTLADLFDMLAQVMYAVSDNGVGVMTQNFLHPLWQLLDTLRPIVNIDLDELINTMICRFTYRFGQYGTEKEMRQVMHARGAELKLKKLSVNSILNLLAVIASVEIGGVRKHLELKPPYHAAMEDLACLRESYESKSYVLDENGRLIPRTAYRLNTDGKDALTAMISMGIEVLCYGDNADVMDAAIEAVFGQKGVVKTAIELMKGLPAKYTSAFDWAYILGDDASAAEKSALLEQISAEGFVPAAAKRTVQAQQDYAKYLSSYDMTDWDEETAVYLVEKLDAMLANALSIDLGGGTLLGDKLLALLGVESDAKSYTVGSLAEALINGLLTDEVLDKVLALFGDFLNGRDNEGFDFLAKKINKRHPEDALAMIRKASAKIAQYNKAICEAATGIGIYLDRFNIDITKSVRENGVVTYYGFDGEPTGLTRTVLGGDYTRLSNVLYELTEPLQPLLAFLLLGKDLTLFNASGVTAHRNRRDDLVHVTGLETYRYVLLPLLEALGFEGLKSAKTYVDEDYNIAAMLRDLFDSLLGRIQSMLNGSTIDELLAIVPDLLYYINSNGLGVSLQNLTAQVIALLDFYNDYAGKTGDERLTLSGLLKQFIGLDIDLEHIELSDLFALVMVKNKTRDETDDPVVYQLYPSEFAARLLDNFTTGKIYANTATACDFSTYRMTYLGSQDKAATITILLSVALDLLEDPVNTDFWNTAVGENVRQTLINVLNLNDFKFDYQDPTWLFTEYANTDHLVTALTLSKLFETDPYAGKMWTREMAAELVENLESFINDMLYLLGLEINGIKITDFRSLVHALLGGMLFSQDMMNKLTAMLGQIKPLLDKYDPDGAIAGFIKRLLGLDVHAWDAYAPGGVYENGKDWGFSTDVTEAAVDANGEVFEKAITELLTPLASVMAFVLADSDYTFFAEGDGLGKNAEPIQLTLPGAEGYKYGLVPLFEALNIDGSPKNLVQNLRDGDICDPAAFTAKVQEDPSFAVTGVVHPLVAMLQKLMDSTATQLLELFPSIVYFINCNGIDTVLKNLIHSVLIIANAAEPMKEQITQLVYDEQGFDLYRTLKLEKLVKEQLYTLVGVSEGDVKAVYEQCGDTWKTVDGLEDVDFRYLFSVALAAVNNLLAKNGLPFKFTSIAALAVNELTHGYVRSYDSLTGKTAYTMVMDKTIDKYCFGDLLSILIRIILKFLSVDGNADALVALIKTKATINGVGEAAVSAFLHLLAGYMSTLGGFEVAMLSIYYTVYGASQASGSGVEAYDHVNDELTGVVEHLENLDNDIARAVMQILLKAADENIGDIIGSKGLAGNGLFRFFKQIFEWLMKIIDFFKAAFKK